MVKFGIDIEAIRGESKGINILLKTERNEAVEAEEEAAQHLLPALRELLKERFFDGDEESPGHTG
jgi:hypothetical protein